MFGFYFTSVRKCDSAVSDAHEFLKNNININIRDYFVASLSSNNAYLNDNEKEISVLAHIDKASLDGAMFVAPTRYFCDPYSAVMISYVYNCIKPGGAIVLPYYEDAVSERTGFWNIAWLRNLMGKEERLLGGSNYLVFQRRNELRFENSILAAFLTDADALAKQFMHDKESLSDPEYLRSCSGFLINNNYEESSGMKQATADMPDIVSDLEGFYSYISYSVTGVSYKAEAIRRLKTKYLPDRKHLHIVDIGGGIGLVQMELLLTEQDIARATVCEPLITTLSITRKLFEIYQDHLMHRYQQVVCAAQDYPFPDSVDIVCEFASLLYVPRDQLQDTLDRAWEALNPGGIFVIHENIRRDIFKSKSYYHMVFTVDELEMYLSKYGDIDYYRSSDLYSIEKKDASNLTVFRVIQKK